jgi:osmotically-inducible protein OsmY
MRTDAELQRAVQEELSFDPSIVATDIGVTVKNGIVTLFGTVPNYTVKWAAERAAEQVAGVRALAKDLIVKLPGETERSDAEIAEAALKALAWDVQVPEKRLAVEVQNGEVTLKGQVEWYYQREAAEENVRKLTGVVGVSNQITIKPNVTAKEIRSKIESALQRRAVKDARQITVDVDGGKVTLRGEVHCWAERENAELAAWAAEGVSEVRDEIRIQA